MQKGFIKKQLARGKECELKRDNDGNILSNSGTFNCHQLFLLFGSRHSKMKNYHMIQIDVLQRQGESTNDEPDLTIEKLSFDIKFHKMTFKACFNLIKLVFVGCAIYVYCRFHERLTPYERSDLGIIQKWIQSLLIMLVFFNDPLCALQGYIPTIYSIQQTFFESLFIAMLLFFWLLFVHSISVSTLVAISPTGFFAPKIALGVSNFIYLICLRAFIYISFAQDPFFSVVEGHHVNTFYYVLRYVGIVLTLAYLVYFVVLMLKASETIKQFKSQYMLVTCYTLMVVLTSAALMTAGGQVSQRMNA